MLPSRLNKVSPASKILRQPTLRDVYRNTWYLNKHERSQLDRYFMIIRTKAVLRKKFTDDELLLPTIINAGIEYNVIFQGVKNWMDFQEDSVVCASFRSSKEHELAFVLVRAYTGDRKVVKHG